MHETGCFVGKTVKKNELIIVNKQVCVKKFGEITASADCLHTGCAKQYQLARLFKRESLQKHKNLKPEFSHYCFNHDSCLD